MGRAKGNQRDGFTASGAGPKLDGEFDGVEAPPFVPKYRRPPYMDRRIIRKQKGPEGE